MDNKASKEHAENYTDYSDVNYVEKTYIGQGMAIELIVGLIMNEYVSNMDGLTTYDSLNMMIHLYVNLLTYLQTQGLPRDLRRGKRFPAEYICMEPRFHISNLVLIDRLKSLPRQTIRGIISV